ncbi:MAG: ATP synthase F0 subunit A [Myxococcales bacterium]|nr:MAG: ATP synthase F0 subunit A [Myxococcales bacterium]
MQHFSWYDLIPAFGSLSEWLREKGVLGEHSGAQHMISATLVFLFLVFVAVFVGRRYRDREKSLVPPRRFGLTALFEFLIEKLETLVHDVIGHGAEKHVPILLSTFIFIFFSNLLGAIPGFPPPTSTVATNAAMAFTIFLYYNYAGFRAHGVGYLKHFAGPVIWLAWLMIPIELIGHLVRPVSLSLRLAGNITGDHMVLGIFTDLTYIVVPMAFVILGLFIAFVQAFVFTLLSTIYIALAVSHDH